MPRIGKVSDIRRERDFEWVIEDFSLLPCDAYYKSPSFTFAGESWCFQIYPNGEKRNESIGYIGLYLMRESSGPPISIDFSLILETTLEETSLKEDFFKSNFDEAECGWGCAKFKNRSQFLEEESPELDEPVDLTVICTTKYVQNTDNGTIQSLLNDLKGMMSSGDNSDIIVKVKEEEFKLHRNILMARSPYFSSMFKSDMKETKTGTVTIDDCEPDIFRTFVHFIYTGKVDKLSAENVCELYETTDMYQEDQLKNVCLDFMMKTISKDTFHDFIGLALKYDEKKLFEKSVEFFRFKRIEILRSEKWQNFEKEYPTQANELILKTLNHHFK